MPNHLASQTSPYLLQHVDNAVNWFPWGEEALNLAIAQDKPILLSIGYSACHWCHVMARECFEDEEVAAVMNQYFVNVKVDREERPDLDQIYQTAHYILTQRNGGWPLTIFLTPQQQPFFSGTYFPKYARHGLPGFLDLLPRVAQTYLTQGRAVAQQSMALQNCFAETLPSKSSVIVTFSEIVLDVALHELNQKFDPVYGGFGSAPKFFHPVEISFCLQRYLLAHDKEILNIVLHTLEKIAWGGVYDQLGGGFCRYSTDRDWQVPHFEKMLYDNGLLLQVYSYAWLVCRKSLFKRIVSETAQWVMREMQLTVNSIGGYFSSIDADSEHEEGRFYVWTREQAAQVLTEEEFSIFASYYGLNQPPNFEQQYWNLRIVQSFEDIAVAANLSREKVQEILQSAQCKLFAVRQLRNPPERDEKIITSWNALMIKGMAQAGHVFEYKEWTRSAVQAVDFIRTNLWKNNRLLAISTDGQVHLNAYLDDYAFLLDALFTLMQTNFRQVDLKFALELAEVLLCQFEDQDAGGFFFTSHDHEQLIHRPKPSHDHAIPSGNGVAVTVLQRLGLLLGDVRFLQTVERALQLFYPMITDHPSEYCSFLFALNEFISPPKIVILRGDEPGLIKWQRQVQREFPQHFVFALPPELIDLPPSLNKALPADGIVHAWVCQGFNCLPAISDIQELLHVCEVRGKI